MYKTGQYSTKCWTKQQYAQRKLTRQSIYQDVDGACIIEIDSDFGIAVRQIHQGDYKISSYHPPYVNSTYEDISIPVKELFNKEQQEQTNEDLGDI